MTWQIHQGEALAVLQDLESNSVDLVATDPPYSSGGMYRGDRTQATRKKYIQTGTLKVAPDFTGDNRDQRSYLAWSTMWLAQCLRIAKPGSLALVFTDWRQLPTTSDALQCAGWVWRGIVTWDKTRAARPIKGGYRMQSEFVLWGSKGPMQATADSPALDGVFQHMVRPQEKHHQAGKPLELMVDLLKICPAGGTVLDPFCGSGTTGVACAQLGLGFIGVELDEGYHQLAEERVKAAYEGLAWEAPGMDEDLGPDLIADLLPPADC